MTQILYFTASWCGPCRKFGPLLTAEAEARGLRVVRLDLDEVDGRRLAEAYGVQSVPTVVVTRPTPSGDTEVIDRFGAVGVMVLRDRLEAAAGR